MWVFLEYGQRSGNTRLGERLRIPRNGGGEGGVPGQGAGALPARWLLHMMIDHDVRSSGVHTRRRRLFVTTLTELKAMAALARMGLSMMPQMG